MFLGATLLARTPEEQKVAAASAIFAFEHAARNPDKLTAESREFLVAAIEASHTHDSTGALTVIGETLAAVPPTRQAVILDELADPVKETKFGFRLKGTSFSRKLVASPRFAGPYKALIENWDKHPVEIQQAILQVEAHLPAMGQQNSVELLTRLVKESHDTVGAGGVPGALPNDLHLKAAFILAATSPQNSLVQSQLEKLLAAVPVRPHVLRRNSSAQNRNPAADTKVEEGRKPTMRDVDADRLHAAVALKLACGGSLSDATSRQFASLIVRDT